LAERPVHSFAGIASGSGPNRLSGACRMQRHDADRTFVSCGSFDEWPSARTSVRFTVDPSILLQMAETESTLAHAVLNIARLARDAGVPIEGFELVFGVLERQHVLRLILGERVPQPRQAPTDVRFRVATSAQASGGSERLEIAVMPIDRPMLRVIVLVLERRGSDDFAVVAWRID
jgi:hypothetical protein